MASYEMESTSGELLKIAIPARTILKTEGDNVELTIMEMPEMIMVDTMIVTKNSYAASNMEFGTCTVDLSQIKVKPVLPQASPTLESIIPGNTTPPFALQNNTFEIESIMPGDSSINSSISTAVQTPKPTNDVGAPIQFPVITKIDASTCTESPNPMRDRSIQTEAANEKVSVGVQCNMASELEDEDLFEEVIEETTQSRKEEFLKFITDHIQLYGKEILECKICGEVKKEKNDIEYHMALHFGPGVLCTKCGAYLEHEILLDDHLCLKNKRKMKQNQQILKCPYSSRHCLPVMPFKNLSDCFCNICHKSHKPVIMMRDKKMVLIRNTKGSLLFPHLRCEICLNLCSNALKYKSHRRKCLKKYMKRLTKQKSERSANGYNSKSSQSNIKF